MYLNRYPFERGGSALVYEFLNYGAKGAVSKLVIFTPTEVKGIYNLGFGDKDQASGEISDVAVTNNGDSQKVLATIASTIYDFTHGALYLQASNHL